MRQVKAIDTSGQQFGEPSLTEALIKIQLSIIIPARNEQHSIKNLVSNTKETNLGLPVEILVVDDGSKDQTRELALSCGVTVISHEKNLGKGAAMKTGVISASGNVIVFLDGDGAHDPDDLRQLIEPIVNGKADLVIGSRCLTLSEVPSFPATRKFFNDAASLLISTVVSYLLPLANLSRHPIRWTRITDCTSGYRAITRDAWQSLELHSQRYQIETEMIYEAIKKRLVINEVPIKCHWNSDNSDLSIVRDGIKTSALLAKKLIKDTFRQFQRR